MPVGKKRHQPSKTSHDPKSVFPHQRLREFANENLTVSAGKLFCTRNLLYRTTWRFRLCYNIMVDEWSLSYVMSVFPAIVCESVYLLLEWSISYVTSVFPALLCIQFE